MDLPKRPKEIRVDVSGGEVSLFMEPLTDQQYYTLNERAEYQVISEAEDPEKSTVATTIRVSTVPGLFEDRLRRVEGLTIEGAPFDIADPEHLVAIRQSWKVLALMTVVRYGMGLSEAERGNSKGPAAPSAEGTTP
jgi:hypothetical protein